MARYEENVYPRNPHRRHTSPPPIDFTRRTPSHDATRDGGPLSPEDTSILKRALEKREFTLIGEDEVLKSYDYVIAGGGLAGLVLASRLSEDSSRSVLVLEAGMSGDEVKSRVDSPAGAYYQSIVGSDYDWKHVTENQPNLNNRDISWPRGKILGGSTAMNAMYLVRPSRTELDSWSNLLTSAQDTTSFPSSSTSLWTWDSLFAGMRKSENFTAPSPEPWAIGGNFAFSAANHGTGGPMSLSYPEVMFSIVGNWTGALERAGIEPLSEPNGGVTLGGFITPSSVNPTNLTRSYSRPAYIDSLPPRSNLHILPEATVTKVGFSERVRSDANEVIANTVEFGRESGGMRYVVGVLREVVLAGGPLGSPKILLHSGVGPADVLGQVGIDVVSEVPGVGQHLQDHMTAGIVWESRVETAGDVQQTGTDFASSREFLSFINDAVAFVNMSLLFDGNDAAISAFQTEIRTQLANITSTSADGTTTNTMIPSSSLEVVEGYKATYELTATTFFENSAQIEMLMSVISPGVISIQSALQHPYSRGRVYINSTNPFDPIVIDPQYFSHPADRTIMRQGVKLVRQVGVALGDLLGPETVPGTAIQTDEEIDAWLTRSGANTQYHPAGSCAMLPKKWGGVVDGKMRVYGVANVRVVDSSVFPYEFAAHLASVTFGVAEVMSGVIESESFEVPRQARVDDNSLGRQGSGARANLVEVGAVVLAGLVGVYGVM
ncbi:hypothetical protein MD484_g8424, partial [Candolleomyces efflorescens]